HQVNPLARSDRGHPCSIGSLILPFTLPRPRPKLSKSCYPRKLRFPAAPLGGSDPGMEAQRGPASQTYSSITIVVLSSLGSIGTAQQVTKLNYEGDSVKD